jgi:hypothetical protein
MTPEECAYAAGIIDGEGSVSCGYSNSNVAPTLFVAVGMKQEDVPVWLLERFGGAVNICNGYPQWIVTGKACTPILQAIQPYVVLKKKQVELALAISDHITARRSKRLTDEELLVRFTLAERLRALSMKVR